LKQKIKIQKGAEQSENRELVLFASSKNAALPSFSRVCHFLSTFTFSSNSYLLGCELGFLYRLQLGMDGEELTEQETALYDRQIRVWGADAQRRLSKSHILVCGMKGTVAEFCKNIVLAGVGSLTLVDDRVATDEALFSSNFLIPPDENVYGGKTLAELCCNSLKDFNPMVRVSVEKGLPLLFCIFFIMFC
jgi:hypothetical protein